MNKRSEILETARSHISGAREADYGSPAENFAVIGQYWTVWLQKKLIPGADINAHDVAMMQSLLKTGRIQTGKPKDDNYIDNAGYVAIAGEIRT